MVTGRRKNQKTRPELEFWVWYERNGKASALVWCRFRERCRRGPAGEGVSRSRSLCVCARAEKRADSSTFRCFSVNVCVVALLAGVAPAAPGRGGSELWGGPERRPGAFFSLFFLGGEKQL